MSGNLPEDGPVQGIVKKFRITIKKTYFAQSVWLMDVEAEHHV
jgi:hypothetical protein